MTLGTASGSFLPCLFFCRIQCIVTLCVCRLLRGNCWRIPASAFQEITARQHNLNLHFLRRIFHIFFPASATLLHWNAVDFFPVIPVMNTNRKSSFDIKRYITQLQVQSAFLLPILHFQKTGISYSAAIFIQSDIYDLLLVHVLPSLPFYTSDASWRSDAFPLRRSVCPELFRGRSGLYRLLY